jgi:hypothetical protein
MTAVVVAVVLLLLLLLLVWLRSFSELVFVLSKTWAGANCWFCRGVGEGRTD